MAETLSAPSVFHDPLANSLRAQSKLQDFYTNGSDDNPFRLLHPSVPSTPLASHINHSNGGNAIIGRVDTPFISTHQMSMPSHQITTSTSDWRHGRKTFGWQDRMHECFRKEILAQGEVPPGLQSLSPVRGISMQYQPSQTNSNSPPAQRAGAWHENTRVYADSPHGFASLDDKPEWNAMPPTRRFLEVQQNRELGTKVYMNTHKNSAFSSKRFITDLTRNATQPKPAALASTNHLYDPMDLSLHSGVSSPGSASPNQTPRNYIDAASPNAMKKLSPPFSLGVDSPGSLHKSPAPNGVNSPSSSVPISKSLENRQAAERKVAIDEETNIDERQTGSCWTCFRRPSAQVRRKEERKKEAIATGSPKPSRASLPEQSPSSSPDMSIMPRHVYNGISSKEDVSRLRLGIFIAHYKDPDDHTKWTHVVYGMSPDGAAKRSHSVLSGDIIVGLNGETIEFLEPEVVKARFEQAQRDKDDVFLVLKRFGMDFEVTIHLKREAYISPGADVYAKTGSGPPMTNFDMSSLGNPLFDMSRPLRDPRPIDGGFGLVAPTTSFASTMPQGRTGGVMGEINALPNSFGMFPYCEPFPSSYGAQMPITTMSSRGR